MRRRVLAVFVLGWAITAAACSDDSRRLLPEDAGGLGLEDLGAVTDTGPRGDAGAGDAGASLDRPAVVDGAIGDSGADVPGPTDRGALDAGAPDAGAFDAGPRDAGGVDTGSADAGSLDAGGLDAGRADSGLAEGGVDSAVADSAAHDAAAASARGTPTLDGVIGSDWPSGAWVLRNTVASPWGPTQNALTSLHVAYDSQRLYLGITGVVEDTNAIVVYLDRDYVPGSTATGVTSIASLTDGVGALDNSVSCNITTMPAGFGAELAWGTRGLRSKAATELSEFVGLRDVACTACRGDFRWLQGDQAVCTRTGTPACEIGIAWTSLYDNSRPPPQPQLGLFVRLTNAEGTDLSNNQTLPEQSPPEPTAARSVLAFAPTGL